MRGNTQRRAEYFWLEGGPYFGLCSQTLCLQDSVRATVLIAWISSLMWNLLNSMKVTEQSYNQHLDQA